MDNNLTENNHKDCFYPPNIKLMTLGETMRCRKVRGILRYYEFNKLLSPKKFAHHGCASGYSLYNPNGNDSEDIETNKTFAIPNFMPQILSDDEIAKGINSLNSKQREVLNMIRTLAKDYVKDGGHDVEPVYIFLPGSGGKGKATW